MAEQPDASEKTEEASEKKIADARERGNVPFSREAPVFASLLGLLLVLAIIVGEETPVLVDRLARLIDGAGDTVLQAGPDATLLLFEVGRTGARFLAPIVAIFAGFGLVASLAQNAPGFVPERIRPQADRISPAAGLKRIFGTHGQVEFLRALFKFAAVGAICIVLLKGQIAGMITAIYVDPVLLPAQVLGAATRLVAAVCAATIILVAADLLWTRFKWRADLKMSRRELKDEMKQAEGDPLVRARMRSLAKDRSRRRMLTNVPRATLVIANPTHFAIALRYRREEGGAPLVLAKGKDRVALRIRDIAERHAIPVIEDPVLARAMFEAVEVDRWIPAEFYRAIAKILYYLYQHDSGRPQPDGAAGAP